MALLRKELEELHQKEKEREEIELKSVKERQSAISDLQRGVRFEKKS